MSSLSYLCSLVQTFGTCETPKLNLSIGVGMGTNHPGSFWTCSEWVCNLLLHNSTPQIQTESSSAFLPTESAYKLLPCILLWAPCNLTSPHVAFFMMIPLTSAFFLALSWLHTQFIVSQLSKLSGLIITLSPCNIAEDDCYNSTKLVLISGVSHLAAPLHIPSCGH